MKKKLIVALFALLAVTSMATLPIQAQSRCCSLQARGDWQVLENGPEGAVVRVWVLNSCYCNRFVLVTVVANTASGPVQGAYTLFVPAWTSRPVDVKIASEISTVNKLIVTPLGAYVGCRP